MSVEIIVSGSCGCGHAFHVGAEDRGREHDGFYVCSRCQELSGSQGILRARPDCRGCRRALARWDERSCPRCGRETKLEWGLGYN